MPTCQDDDKDGQVSHEEYNKHILTYEQKFITKVLAEDDDEFHHELWRG